MGNVLQQPLSLAAIGKAISIQFSNALTWPDSNWQRPLLIEMQRFELWASNLGLYHSGHSALDYRFRDSPALSQYASRLLITLEETLLSFMEACADDAVDSTGEALEEDEDDEKVEDEDFSSYQTVPIQEEYITNITQTVDRLYALSFQIRNPALRTGLSRALGYTEIDRESGEVFRSWSNEADMNADFLIHRLAQANTRRRQQFKYWNHRNFNLVFAIAHIPESESVVSLDSYVIVSNDNNGDLMLPPPPQVDPDAKEFECPYCLILCGRKMLHSQAWERHVLRDLRPYVCTFENCKQPDQLYDTLSEWVAHESAEHSQRNETPRTCPFCRQVNVSSMHIAYHLRRVARFALPRWNETDAGERGSVALSNINRGASDAGEDSLESSVDDAWATSAKSIFLYVSAIDDGGAENLVDSTVVKLRPVDNTEVILVDRLRQNTGNSGAMAVTWTDDNGNPVPVDYDSIYDGMIIVATLSNPQRSPSEFAPDTTLDVGVQELDLDIQGRDPSDGRTGVRTTENMRAPLREINQEDIPSEVSQPAPEAYSDDDSMSGTDPTIYEYLEGRAQQDNATSSYNDPRREHDAFEVENMRHYREYVEETIPGQGNLYSHAQPMLDPDYHDNTYNHVVEPETHLSSSYPPNDTRQGYPNYGVPGYENTEEWGGHARQTSSYHRNRRAGSGLIEVLSSASGDGSDPHGHTERLRDRTHANPSETGQNSDQHTRVALPGYRNAMIRAHIDRIIRDGSGLPRSADVPPPGGRHPQPVAYRPPLAHPPTLPLQLVLDSRFTAQADQYFQCGKVRMATLAS
ncbi:hypothetical protein BDW74DRAFT_174795 [Aspergillus multicolor]|uniref:uncharacterized protein n=1 Tax=Aspergillus multicolor TaxID=41759 RepID=UPI003CCD4B59